MNTLHDNPILPDAIKRFGVKAQIRKALEELAELTLAIHHRYRVPSDSDVVEEIADVLIMCAQLRLIWGAEEVDAEIDRKMSRLKALLDGWDNLKGES